MISGISSNFIENFKTLSPNDDSDEEQPTINEEQSYDYTTKPSTTKPSTAKPTTTKPSTTKPSTKKPSTKKPSTTKPKTRSMDEDEYPSSKSLSSKSPSNPTKFKSMFTDMSDSDVEFDSEKLNNKKNSNSRAMNSNSTDDSTTTTNYNDNDNDNDIDSEDEGESTQNTNMDMDMDMDTPDESNELVVEGFANSVLNTRSQLHKVLISILIVAVTYLLSHSKSSKALSTMLPNYMANKEVITSVILFFLIWVIINIF